MLRLIRMGIEWTERFTGKSWLTDPYTFDLTVAVTQEWLGAFRPDGEPRLPDTGELVPELTYIPEPTRSEMKAMVARHPPGAYSLRVAHSIVLTLRARGRSTFVRNRAEEAVFKRAADYLEGLLTSQDMRAPEKQREKEPSK